MRQSRVGPRTALFYSVKLLVPAGLLALVALAGGAVFALARQQDPTPVTPLGPPHFVDVTSSSGVDHTYNGDYPFAVGGGVATFDCNGDGKPDLFLAGGANPAALYRDDTPLGGDLRFTRIASHVTDLTDVLGAYPIDHDGDGITDLVVLRRGESVLLRGVGNCQFTLERTLDDGQNWDTAFSATWESGQERPTLALGRYLQLDSAGQPESSYRCADSVLLRPDAAPLPLSPGYCSLSMLFSDWNRSGHGDLRVTNDRQYYVGGEDQLWRMVPGQPPRLYTDADGWVSLQIWGMGIASFDLNGRGYPDVFLTSQGDNKLQTLATGPGHPTYRDMALKRGVTSAQPFTGGDAKPSTAWHPQFEDVNNDGFVDLFVSKGNVSAQPDYANRDPSDLFLGQADGTFREAADAAGIVSFDRGRGAALADFSMDGRLDLVEVNYGQAVRIWQNVRPGSGHWLGVRLAEPGGNRDAIGAWIEVQVGRSTIRRELTVGGGHVSGQLGWSHFGVGTAAQVGLRVQWPDGEVGPWLSVGANQYLTVDRGSAQPIAWSP
jgi:enediyne biosynthesis protein E4